MQDIYVSRDMLLTAITETVKVITIMSDVEVTLKDGSQTTGRFVSGGITSRCSCYVTLRKSEYPRSPQLLRSSTNTPYLFSRTMSKKLNAPLYASTSYWQMLEITQPPTSRPSSPSSKPTSSPSSPPSSPLTSSKSKIISLISEHLQSS